MTAPIFRPPERTRESALHAEVTLTATTKTQEIKAASLPTKERLDAEKAEIDGFRENCVMEEVD